MIRYINTKFDNQTETLDELNQADYSTYKEFKQELKRLVHEYTISGNGSPWVSSRACKGW